MPEDDPVTLIVETHSVIEIFLPTTDPQIVQRKRVTVILN